MHYYQFNIGDYKSHTSHLNHFEDLAYRRLLDLYYLHEKPLDNSIEAVARLIGMSDYLADVEMVLLEFFTCQDEGGWVNSRADKEIAHYKAKSEQASNAGKASAKARLNGCSTDVQRTFNQTITNNQEPITKIKPLPDSCMHLHTSVLPLHTVLPVTVTETVTVTVSEKSLTLPEWLPESSIKEFKAHRVKLKKPMTDRSVALLVGELEKIKAAGHDPIECLNTAIFKGWLTPYMPKDATNQGKPFDMITFMKQQAGVV